MLRRRLMMAQSGSGSGGSDVPEPPVEFPLYIYADTISGSSFFDKIYLSNSLGDEVYRSLRDYLKYVALTGLAIEEFGIEIYLESESGSTGWGKIMEVSYDEAYDYVVGMRSNSGMDANVFFKSYEIEWSAY